MCASFINRLRRLFNDERGPTAVEYAVMLALIVVLVLGAVHSVGTVSSDKFQSVSSSLNGGGRTDGNQNGSGQW